MCATPVSSNECAYMHAGVLEQTKMIGSTNSLYDGIDDFAVEVAVYPAKVRLS